MVTSTLLALGSPIKDSLAPSMLGPTGTAAAAVSGPTLSSGPTTAALVSGPTLSSGPTTAALAAKTSGVALTGGATTAAALATGTGVAGGTQVATGAGVTKTAVTFSLLGSLFYVAAAVAVGYLGYRAAKTVWESAGAAVTKARP